MEGCATLLRIDPLVARYRTGVIDPPLYGKHLLKRIAETEMTFTRQPPFCLLDVRCRKKKQRFMASKQSKSFKVAVEKKVLMSLFRMMSILCLISMSSPQK